MPVLSLACHLPHNTPHIPSRYNNEQTTKQTKAINNSYIYINISCKCDTNRAGHFTLDAYASRPVACFVGLRQINIFSGRLNGVLQLPLPRFALSSVTSNKRWHDMPLIISNTGCDWLAQSPDRILCMNTLCNILLLLLLLFYFVESYLSQYIKD